MRTLTPLIAYYSKGGHTERAAAALAEIAGASLSPIEAPRYRGMIGGIARGLWDVARRRLPADLAMPAFDGHDPVILAGPVWAGQPAPPLRALIAAARDRTGRTGLLLTCGEAKLPKGAVAACAEILGRPFTAQAAIPNGIDGKPEMRGALGDFAAALGLGGAEAAE